MLKPKIIICTLVIIFSITGPLLFTGYRLAQKNSNLPITPKLVLLPNTFNQLPGWDKDNHTSALSTFDRSCRRILKQNPTKAFGNDPNYATFANWQAVCKIAIHLKHPTEKIARSFFEKHFTPYLVTDNYRATGLFTGYYLPLLKGSLHKEKAFSVPIYARPKDLVDVNLGLFRNSLRGISLKGQLAEGKLLPYPDRAAIDKGQIKDVAPVLVWVDNPIQFFFMQIQGSGLISLPHAKTMLVGYADSNGRPYKAIGRVLIAEGALHPDAVSMKNIYSWLEAHPDKIESILNTNQSFVFFRVIESSDPVGAEQVPLTSERSLAVDPNYIPLGAPLWLATNLPQTPVNPAGLYQHLFIAQDTGGAIKGVVRGDVYWGPGNRAENIASDMKNSGQYWVLIPKLTIR